VIEEKEDTVVVHFFVGWILSWNTLGGDSVIVVSLLRGVVVPSLLLPKAVLTGVASTKYKSTTEDSIVRVEVMFVFWKEKKAKLDTYGGWW
jgi:hypothetical protein